MNLQHDNLPHRPDPLPWIILTVLLVLVFGGLTALVVGGQDAEPAPIAVERTAPPGPVPATPAPAPEATRPPAPPLPAAGTVTGAPRPPPVSATVIPHPPVTHGTVVSPPSPAAAAGTPRPGTPVASPAPPSLTLTLRMLNPELGQVIVEPPSADNRYPRGTRVTLVAAPKTGNRFTGWQGDASGQGNVITVVMDRHKTITGEFARLTFTLNIEATPQGGAMSVLPSRKSFEPGTKVTVEARPAAGYIFQSWGGDASGSQNPVTNVMDGDKMVGATFVPGQYSLTTKVNPMGFIDISPPSGHHDSGTRVTLTARPSPNFRFVSWSGDVSATMPAINIIMSSNKSLTANFVKIVTLTTVVNPVGYGSVSPATSDYDQGTEVTITAVAYGGFEFVGWTGHITSTNATERIVMDADRSVMANFEIIRRN